MPNGKFFRYGYGAIVVLVIIFLLTKVGFLLVPVLNVLKTLFLPFVLAGVLYYLLRPLVNFLSRRKVNRSLAILAIFLLMVGLFAFIVIEIVPVLQNQVTRLIDNIPQIVSMASDQFNRLLQDPWISGYYKQHEVDLSAKIAEYTNSIVSNTGNAFNALFGFISNVVVLLSTVPFILFYLLKEGDKVPDFILRLIPDKHHEEGRGILSQMDGAISSYVQGKIFVSLCLGLLIYIGYAIIGIEYSLLLALSAALLNVIPFVGLFIGIIPSIVVAFIHSPAMLIKVIVVVVIVQQIEANLLSPQIMGKKLDMHPLTIILLLIVVGGFGGLLGMFLAIPIYAVLKIMISHLYRIYVLRK